MKTYTVLVNIETKLEVEAESAEQAYEDAWSLVYRNQVRDNLRTFIAKVDIVDEEKSPSTS